MLLSTVKIKNKNKKILTRLKVMMMMKNIVLFTLLADICNILIAKIDFVINL